MSALLIEKIVDLANQIAKRKTAQLKKFNISQGQDAFLIALLKEDGMTMGAMSRTIDTLPPSVAKFATKLEKEELITREASKVDSRQQHAFLTEKGREVANSIFQEYQNIDEKIFAKLKPKAREKLAKILVSVQENKKVSNPAAKKPEKAGKSSKNKSETKKKKNKEKKAKS